MQRKWTWWVPALAAVVLVAPVLVAQTTYWVSEDDGDDGQQRAYTLFSTDEASAFLGVTSEEETEHDEGGARLTSIVKGSPAEKAGLEAGDIIVGFDKQTVRGPVGLTKRIRDREAGDSVQVTVLRDGRRKTFDVELGERSAHSGMAWGVAPRVLERLENIEIPEFDFESLEGLEGLEKLEGMDFNFDFGELQEQLGRNLSLFCEDGECENSTYFLRSNRPRLGVQLTETTPELRQHLGGSADAGVLVGKVLDGSAAKDAGMEVGDLIVRVGGDEVASTGDLRRALAERAGETFDIEVMRDGRSVSLSITLDDEDDDRPSGPRALMRVPRPDRSPVVAPAVPFDVSLARVPRPQAAVAPRPPFAVAPSAVATAPAAASPVTPRALPAPPVAVHSRGEII